MVIFSKTRFAISFLGVATILGAAGSAQAGLEICNDTSDNQSISIGYEGSDGWTSEGWWNIDPSDCSTVIGGDLTDQYFYLRAEVAAGDFEGDGFYFCTTPEEYTIVGDTECESRGYEREDFVEIDAGAGSVEYTYRLTDENTTAVQSASNTGLKFCNETQYEQSISIGYEGAEGWTSEGWWNIPPGDCNTPLARLEKEYYYFRAEVDGGSFEGDGHSFCTTPEAYTIVGDQNCEARGYETEDFREVNVGTNALFTYTLITTEADAAPLPPTEPVPADGASGLEFCNATQEVQSVSIGYDGDEGFTSEGWWNVDPDDCAKVITGALTKRYYYYRAEVDGGEFAGDNAFFCTDPQAYTIVGDTNCEARGYFSEDFAELDVGEGTTGYSFTIGGASDGAVVRDDVGAPVETVTATPEASDGFQVCNETAATQSFSIGYEGEDDWTSEGWWNVDAGDCTTLISGPLSKQYFYLRVEQDGGDFEGNNYFFCTTPEAYTIVGDQNCEARGYDREDFIEVDIGAGATSYTYTLAAQGNLDPAPDSGRGDVAETSEDGPEGVVDNMADAGAGLEFCNDTTATQSISVGYEGAEGWISEGWWNIDPGACTTPALDGKNRRYFYYRAEVDGGDFAGQNYFFCTQPDAYTIVGDTDCVARGFDNEDFREIDTGGETGLFTFTLVATDSPSAPVEPAPGIAPEEPALTVIGGGADFDRTGEAVQEAPEEPAEVEIPEPEPEPAPEPEPEPEPVFVPEPEEPAGGGRRGGSRE